MPKLTKKEEEKLNIHFPELPFSAETDKTDQDQMIVLV